jgi:hypothetical protein
VLDPSLVQSLLAEKRELMIAAERLKLENADLRKQAGRHDPRVLKLEEEVRRLREQVELVRAERDHLRAAIEEALAQLRRG